MTLRRWLDDESGATSAERELLRAGLDSEPPAFAERAVWQRLSASLGVPHADLGDVPDVTASAGASAATAGVSHAGSSMLLTFVKGLALGVGVTAAAVGAQKALEPSAPRMDLAERREPRPAPLVASAFRSAPLPPLEPAGVESRGRPAKASSPRSAAPALERSPRDRAVPNGAGSVAVFPDSLGPTSGLSEEAGLLRRARAELQAGSLALAFATLEASRERFATPELVQEREALTIELLYRSGQRAAAGERTLAFLTRFPESPHAARLRGFLVVPR